MAVNEVKPSYTTQVVEKVQLPDGSVLSIKDANVPAIAAQVNANSYAIDALGKPMTYEIASASTTPIGYNYSDEQEGTLSPNESLAGTIYLVPAGPNGGASGDYVEVICIMKADGTSAWEQIGTTTTDLSDYEAKDDLAKDVVAKVAVAHATSTTDDVLGTGTGFTVSSTDVTVTPTTTHVVASASDGGYSAPTTENFVKSVTLSDAKLATTSITGTNGTVDVPNVTNAGTASTWTFTMGTEEGKTTTLIIGGGNGSAPTLGTAIKAAVVASSATTVATGATATADDNGSTVVTGLSAAPTASGVTALGTFTNPSVTLSTATSGGVTVMTGATAALTSATVTADTTDTVKAVTVVGNPTLSVKA